MENEIILNWADWLIILNMLVGLLIAAYLHGTPRTDFSLLHTFINTACLAIFLYFGGLWS